MAIKPLTDYLEAREAWQRGDSEAAFTALEQALGSPPQNHFIRRNASKLLDYHNLAGESMLELVRVEMARRHVERTEK